MCVCVGVCVCVSVLVWGKQVGQKTYQSERKNESSTAFLGVKTSGHSGREGLRLVELIFDCMR